MELAVIFFAQLFFFLLLLCQFFLTFFVAVIRCCQGFLSLYGDTVPSKCHEFASGDSHWTVPR